MVRGRGERGGTGWIRALIEQAHERGVEIMSYTDYWARTAAGAAREGNN
jgi:hypothetical protein